VGFIPARPTAGTGLCVRLFFILIVTLLLTGLAGGQTKLTLPEVADSAIANLVPVTAPAASCAAISDPLAMLAIGHKSGTTPHVSLIRLDVQGKPPAAPTATITLPRPAGLEKLANYPLALVFHARLPLLYVWQDIGNPTTPMPAEEQNLAKLDHLLIYRVDEKEPRLLQSLGHGPEFIRGHKAGAIVLDAKATRLYVPNLYPPGVKPEAAYPSVGYFRLDADGLPLRADEGKVHQPGPEGLAGVPGYPCGVSFIPISDDVVIVGGGYGPITWDMKDPRVRFQSVFVHDIAAYYTTRLAGHPTLPVMFFGMIGYGYFGRIEHVDGSLTLAPQLVTLEGAAFGTPPVVVARHSQVAFGGVNKVYLLTHDAQGRFTKQRVQAAVTNPSVEALVYSEKFDRLYVAVEKSK
jgi:hypothetical protein